MKARRANPEKRRRRVIGRNEAGSSTAEFAVVAFALMAVVLGVVDMGIGVRAFNVVSHLSGEAARFASVRSTESVFPTTKDDIEQFVVDNAVGLDPARLTVTTDWNPANTPGGKVNVRVTYDYAPITPFVPQDSLRLSSQSTMPITD
jgi:Flp pilus assembly protein TadG